MVGSPLSKLALGVAVMASSNSFLALFECWKNRHQPEPPEPHPTKVEMRIVPTPWPTQGMEVDDDLPSLQQGRFMLCGGYDPRDVYSGPRAAHKPKHHHYLPTSPEALEEAQMKAAALARAKHLADLAAHPGQQQQTVTITRMMLVPITQPQSPPVMRIMPMVPPRYTMDPWGGLHVNPAYYRTSW